MINRPLVRLLLIGATVVACRRPATPPGRPAAKPVQPAGINQPHPDDPRERTNLLNMANGASVVSRTGEVSLENSAVYAIDGDPWSSWISPPFDPEQAIVVSLPTLSRLTELGVSRSPSEKYSFKAINVEHSSDGIAFSPLTTLRLRDTGEDQMFPVAPVEARYLRMTVMQPTGTFAQVNSLIARGTALEPPKPRSLEGCWSVNAMTGAFSQNGPDVWGHIGDIRIEGTTDGRTFRLAWSKGAEYGVALLTVSPDNRHFSGIKWHEEALPLFTGDNWFGERRRDCAEQPEHPREVFETWMSRAGSFPLYGLVFDDKAKLTPASDATIGMLAQVLAHPPKPLRLLGYGDARQLRALRAALQDRGVDLRSIEFVQAKEPRRECYTDYMRLMYLNIDLEIRR
ncbi:MAG: discoidin domain-containing protein [Acidobacteriota bacterium]